MGNKKKRNVKKLSMASLIIIAFCLTGCGNKETTKPKEEATKEVDKGITEKRGDVTFIKMSPEETKSLVKGQHIKLIDAKTINEPDRKILEQMGLEYEIVIYRKNWNKDGTSYIDSDVAVYISGEYEFELPHIKRDDEEFEFVMDGINIIPIVSVDKNGDELSKTVKFSDGFTNVLPLLDEKNYESLKTLLGDTSKD